MATYFFTPYATEVFLLSVAAAGLLSIARIWMNPIAPFVAGFIGDRFGIAKSAVVLLLIMMVSFAFFSITPAKASLLPLVIFNVALAALSIYALRGICDLSANFSYYFQLIRSGVWHGMAPMPFEVDGYCR